MSALAIVWFALPVSGLLALPVALAIAWPAARYGEEARRASFLLAALAASELVPWVVALAGPDLLFDLASDRDRLVLRTGPVVAIAGLLGTLVLSRRFRRGGAWRARAWLVPHALLAAAYLTDLGRFGVRQML
jgi:hypothetical protein